MDDIANTQRIRAVVFDGQLLDHAELQTLFEGVAKAVAPKSVARQATGSACEVSMTGQVKVQATLRPIVNPVQYASVEKVTVDSIPGSVTVAQEILVLFVQVRILAG